MMTEGSDCPINHGSAPAPGTRHFPGPKGTLASLRGAVAMQRNLLSFLCGLESRYANGGFDPIGFTVMGRPMYLLVKPAHIARMLRDSESFARPLELVEVFRRSLGFSAVTVSDEEWRPVRKRTMVYFEVPKLHDYAKAVSEVLQRQTIPAIIELARTGEPFDIFEQMLDVASIAAFVNFIGDQIGETPKPVYQAVNRIFCYIRRNVFALYLPPLWVPTRDNRELRRDLSLLREYLRPKLYSQAAEQTMMGDIARTHKLADGSPNLPKILEEIASNLVGASETTIILMAWALYYIIQNPDVEAQLRAELAAVVGDRLPTTHDFKNMPYLDAVIHETLRLRPPAYTTGRRVVKDTDLDGFLLRRGGLALVCQHITQRHPKLWKDGEAFNPARFLASSAEAPQNRKSEMVFFPFAEGRHLCPGRTYAIYEAKLLVLQLLRQFHFTAADPEHFDNVGLDARVTLRPDRPIRVRAHFTARAPGEMNASAPGDMTCR